MRASLVRVSPGRGDAAAWPDLNHTAPGAPESPSRRSQPPVAGGHNQHRSRESERGPCRGLGRGRQDAEVVEAVIGYSAIELHPPLTFSTEKRRRGRRSSPPDNRSARPAEVRIGRGQLVLRQWTVPCDHPENRKPDHDASGVGRVAEHVQVVPVGVEVVAVHRGPGVHSPQQRGERGFGQQRATRKLRVGHHPALLNLSANPRARRPRECPRRTSPEPEAGARTRCAAGWRKYWQGPLADWRE